MPTIAGERRQEEVFDKGGMRLVEFVQQIERFPLGKVADAPVLSLPDTRMTGCDGNQMVKSPTRNDRKWSLAAIPNFVIPTSSGVPLASLGRREEKRIPDQVRDDNSKGSPLWPQTRPAPHL